MELRERLANLIKDELLEIKKNGAGIILSTHRMESVEELCSHIALINKSKKILDGSVKDIRKNFKSNTFEIDYTGSQIAFANGLWTGYSLLSSEPQDGFMRARIKSEGQQSTNDLLLALLPHINIMGFKEVIPGMNDIFISMVESAE